MRFQNITRGRSGETRRRNAASLPTCVPRCARREFSGGFTLVEVAIVIGIITLLALILLPVFARVRENARRVTCATNLMQIGMGLEQYIQDYGGRTPPRYVVVDPGRSDPPGNAYGHQKSDNWRVQIFPYVKNQELFRCPSNPNKNISASNNKRLFAKVQPIDIKVSYACNYSSSGLGVFANSDGSSAVLKRQIVNPAAVIAVAETTSTAPEIDMDDNKMIGELFAGHSGRSNYLFVDGHVKALRPLETYYTRNGRVINMWHRDLSRFSSKNGK